jgi:peptidoglycan/LPS O-acetylase OafA/YrhL
VNQTGRESNDRPKAFVRADVKNSKSGGRVLVLDGVRGFAIALVMGVHFLGDATAASRLERALVWLGNQGTAGVDLFFVLSGYLITGILFDSRESPRYYTDFYVRRFLRIFPLYYGVLALLFLVLPLALPLPAGLKESASHQTWLWLYGTNIYEAIRRDWAFPYLSHFWSLAIEEHFYLLWPLAVRAFSRRTLVRICLACVAVSLLLRSTLWFLGAGPIAVYVLTPCRLDALCMGGLLALLSRGPRGVEVLAAPSRKIGIAAVAGLLAVQLWHVGTPKLEWLSMPLRWSFYALAFGALIAALVTSSGGVRQLFESRGLSFLGKYSYGLYVFHGIIGFAFLEMHLQERLTAATGSHLGSVLLQATFGVCLSLLVAVASYELYEKRFLLLKRYFESSRDTSQKEGAAAPPVV